MGNKRKELTARIKPGSSWCLNAATLGSSCWNKPRNRLSIMFISLSSQHGKFIPWTIHFMDLGKTHYEGFSNIVTPFPLPFYSPEINLFGTKNLT